MCCNTNIENAVECIKIIVDENRCGSCDNIDGRRVRYQCGHLYCRECVAKADHCLLCLTPPPNAGQQISSLDNPASRRADNAAELLKTFEEAFKINVYKRSRASEQLKAEKELFPQCIQAPIKYFNKRKSLVTPPSNKENRSLTFFPGEQISPVKVLKMENSFNYVQQWLDNNEKDITHKSPRKPFSDLNVNNQSIFKRGVPKRADLILGKTKESSKNFAKKRKMASFKYSEAIVNSQSLLDQHLSPVKKRNDFLKLKTDFDESHTTKLENMNNKTEKDESGIVIDDELIVIDDSQTDVDKDKLALLAVMEANEMNPSQSRSTGRLEFSKVNKSSNVIENVQPGPYKKVPFYKRSYLTEKFNCCKESIFDNNTIRHNEPDLKTKDISICIENSSFITSIKITNIQNNPIFKKHSVSVQTNISDNNTVEKVGDRELNDNKSNRSIVLAQDKDALLNQEQATHSQDLFITEPKTSEEHKSNKETLVANETSPNAMHLVIADSDSDDAANDSSLIQVTAEVHHSNEQLKHGVLAELDQTEVHQRTKGSGWENTPNSSDSSDKENYDPNRSKRVKLDKKNVKKRKRYDILELNSIETMNE